MRQRVRQWRWVMLAAAMSWNCVGVQRQTTLTVGGDLTYAQPEFVSRGCDGEVLRRQQHRQTSVSAHARYEHQGGGLAMARLRGVFGQRLDDSGQAASDDFTPRGSYGLLALGVAGGFDSRYAGFDLGGALLHNGTEGLAVPYGQVRLGNLDHVWFTATAGTMDPAHYLRVLSVGLAGRTGRVRGSAALAMAGYVAEADPDGGLRLSGGGSDLYGGGSDLHGGVEVDLQLLVADDSPFALELGGFLSERPAVRAGLSYRF